MYVYFAVLYVYIYCYLCYTYSTVGKVSLYYRPLIYLKEGVVVPLTESQKKANTKYREKSIKRVPLDVQKEKYEEIKTAATAAGESVNGYIKKAVDQRMERETADNDSVF